ncbi:uncharacterized protein I206_100825 [Kwoniella pini CBS 10737]|uniref:N-acetyltransferase domain-containing protein n=1 Tax=Kwoniella pini CBS 10737 TaxID=1296096 RepID=A0A1B9ICS7_9TREE|nr:uncharacterized protein I206_00502 [Kwoniella pini CBS 10737]OCF53201.1 hypothetical protein I206_00502 [Kwoniella pini CBS 10737]
MTESSSLEPSNVDSTSSYETLTSSSIPENSEYKIRYAIPEDAKEISKLVSETWSKLFGWSITKEDLNLYLNTNLSIKSILKEIKDENNLFILIVSSSSSNKKEKEKEKEEIILGISQLVINSNSNSIFKKINKLKSIELQRIYINLNFKGKGLGTLLIKESEKIIKNKYNNKNQIWLGVWENNENAIKFYKKLGFIQIDEKVFYAGSSKRRDFVMVKDL